MTDLHGARSVIAVNITQILARLRDKARPAGIDLSQPFFFPPELRKVLEPISFEGWYDLVEDWAARKPEAIEEVNRRLAAAGLTIDAVMAQTLCEHLDKFKCIEAMIAMAEARRNGALCEIERHRATLAHRLRQTVQPIDAEYQALDVKSAEPKRLS